MKVLLTGASGQVGSCFKDLVKDKFPQVTLLATDRSQLDITDAVAVNHVVGHFKPDVIFNAAAYTAVDRAESDPEGAWKVNVQAVENLVHAAQHYDVFFVHISTDYVFNGEADTPWVEDHPCAPQSVYGSTKLAGEKAALAYDRSIVMRTSWVFSEYGNNFLKTMLRLGKERSELSIIDDQLGCPTYAGDIASAVMEIILAASRLTGIYHYSGAGEVSWFGFADAILKNACTSGLLEKMPELKAIPTTQFPTPAKRPKYSVMSTAKIAAAGIKPVSWLPRVDSVLQKLKTGQP
ncbi:dTDP-4-dehydrorhamnose reductase [Pantoea sp. XY16]|uniref:dTDP-4-dehydrorhamnose reductase n=1 Tax=Pantoea sp. XY16 TaxID=2976705 RepID=UPI0021A8F2F6|nr:dTDP-4-dehydrorhamnose reductase [Pantoea sp. XY16]MCT2418319.1 dTDP-4-dehydrorhamnose reductase [Pantoea sp. XY16]